ncbi:MAG: hypothetical protein ACP5JL_09600, partial [bacterium]
IIFSKENLIRRSIYPGYVGEIDVIEFIAPRVAAPKRLRIEASLEVNGRIVENHWYIWIYPNTNIDDVRIFDPKGVIRFNLEEPKGRVFVSTRLDDYILDTIYKGARVLYIQPEDGDLPTSCKPFFRESIQVLFEHPVLKRFSPYGLSIEQWYSLATDRVFPKEVMKEYNAKRIISRLDTRTYILDHYLIEVNIGKGILIATTLRFNGGLGDQAENIEYNSAGRYLLKSIVRYLSKTS